MIPEPTGETEVPVATGEEEYVVAKGDNFTTIARKFGVTVQAVIKANPAADPNRIAIGQVLKIPAKPPKPSEQVLPEGTIEYEVKSGDNLYNIAKAHKTTWKTIRDANNLKSAEIRVGQKLIIPLPALPAVAPEGATLHVVKKGDNLHNIAQKHGVTIQTVIEANPEVETVIGIRLYVGQKLIIPPPASN